MVWRKESNAIKGKNVITPVKHGGGCIMVTVVLHISQNATVNSYHIDTLEV